METDQFHKSKATKDGLNWQCKACHSARMRALNGRVAAIEKHLPDTKYCTGCAKIKVAAEFSMNRVMRDGLNVLCKACDGAANKLKAERNKANNKSNLVVMQTSKICSKCKTEKPIEQFSKNSSIVSGIAAWCKRCVSECGARSVQRNRERNSAHDPHADQHATKVCGSCGLSFPVAMFGKLRTTKDGLNPCCAECHRNKGLKYAGNNRHRIMLLSAKTRAKNEVLPFNLELSDVVLPESCPVLGIKFGDGKETRPSLDKIIPSLGYVKGNIVVVSMRANRIKSDATADELAQIADFYKKLAKK